MLCCFEGHLEPVAFSVPQMFTAAAAVAAAAVRLPLSTDPAIETWQVLFPFYSLCLSGTLVLVHMEVLRR